MFLSVVFVTHGDRLDCVKRLLGSLEEYRDEGWVEVVGVDNGSEPQAAAYIKRAHPWVTAIRNDRNRGTSRAFNQGIRSASGTWVLIINDDTVVPEGMLRRFRSFLEENEDVDGIALGLKREGGEYQALRLKILNLTKHHPAQKTRATFVGSGNLLIKKQLLEKAGLYDEHYFAGNEDMDLSLRLKRAGVRILYVPELFIHHLHVYRNKKTNWINFILARRLGDIYYAGKFFRPLKYTVRLYALRDIKKRMGRLDPETLRKVKDILFYKNPSFYDLQRILVTEGLEAAHRYVRGCSAVQNNPVMVSVILPTRNREESFRKALRSVLEQERKDWELIVVNDGDTDVSGILPEGYRIKYLRNDTRAGASASRNRGITAAEGEFIAYLDDDDAWLPNHLSVPADILRRCDFFYSAAEIRDKNGSLFLSSPFSYRKLAKTNFIPTPAVIHRKSLVSSAGGWNEDLPCLQDWELWCRMLLRTEAVIRRVDTTVIINRSEDSITGRHGYDGIRRSVKRHIKTRFALPLFLRHISRRKNYKAINGSGTS